jgi:DNA-binding transcriptional ArsR family regulator
VQAQLRAISDPTRRRILELVADRQLAAGEIAQHFSVSRPAISQHLGVLREAGLVKERREGTRRLYTADPTGLAGIREFVDRFWRVGLDRLKDVAEEAHRYEKGAARDRDR